jgi:replicative DNA helicase
MKAGIHYAKEIENAVLGICLLEKEAFGRIYQTLKPEVFYMDDNRQVFETMLLMYSDNQPLDMLTVWQRMVQDDRQLHETNIAWYLTRLVQDVVSSVHLEYHAHLLLEMYRRREMIRITSQGIDELDDLKAQGYEINQQINNLFAYEQKKDWYTYEELMFNLFVHQNDIKTGKKKFIPTGFPTIDRLNGGFSPGQSIIIGARPGVGKSAFMNKIATNIAKTGKSVGIISLEMNNTEIAARLASLETETEFAIVYRNLFRDEREHERFYNTVANNAKMPLHVSDKTKVDINDIRSKAMKLRHSHGLDFLMIDYLQLVEANASNKNYNREQEVAKISRGLKLMAMEMEIPIVTLCQLNRASTNTGKGENRYPQLSHFRESGAIEQDADIAFILHRDFSSGIDIDENGNSTEFNADLICPKWRNAQPFKLDLHFEPKLMKFDEKPGNNFIKLKHQRQQEDDEQADPF